MAKDLKKVTYTRFAYAIIDFFSQRSSLPFDVSSYVKNDSVQECKFARSKISKFIQRNRNKESENRLFITISMNDMGTISDGRKNLRYVVDNILEDFLMSSCIEILHTIDPSASIEVISSKEKNSMTDYIIIIFNVASCSSIECIISTDSITSKLIERDENRDVVEFNSRLHKNLMLFKQNLK